MKYIAWVTQNGMGCDYTIGCGQALHELKAETMEEAATEAQEMVTETVTWEWSERYDKIVIYEVASTCSVNGDDLYKQEEERLAAEAAREIEEKERATYERLKDKYSGA